MYLRERFSIPITLNTCTGVQVKPRNIQYHMISVNIQSNLCFVSESLCKRPFKDSTGGWLYTV